MLTSQKREAAFRRDLEELLKKHRAELQITDDGKPFGMHRPLAVITMMAEWGVDPDMADYAEYTEFCI